MAFRNEHGALRERVEALERDLAETREKLETRSQNASFYEARAKQLERQLEAAQKELASEAPPRSTPPSPQGSSPQRSSQTIRMALMVSVAMSIGVGFILLQPVAEAPAPAETPTVDPIPSAPQPLAEPAAPVAAAAPSIEPRAIVHRAQVREVSAWPPLRPGDECQVESAVSPRGGGLGVDRLAVRCGETTLYDSAARASGFVMSSLSAGALERRAPEAFDEERLVYLLQYQDQGMRALPMAQIVLDTQRHQARLFRSPESEGAVVLDVDSWSESVAGAPLVAATHAQRYPFSAVVSRGLTLRSLEGAAPIRRADSPACSLEIRPEPEGSNFSCRVLVRCGPAILYGTGTTGYNRCEVEEGAPVRAHDPVAYTDGDPELRFDLADGTLLVRDDPPEGAWSATFAIEPAP